MIGVALKGLAGRKLRAALTAFAVVLGVAMISGTYILTDTIKAGFDTIFTQSYKNTSAVISGRVAFTSGNGNAGSTPFGFPDSVLPKVQKLPDVAAAVGSIADQAQLIGRNGKVIVNGGAPNLAFSVDPNADQRFNPLTLTAGRWPTGPTEIAIDKATADKKHFALGQQIGVAARGPARTFRIVGIAELAAVSSIGGATIAIFDVPTAQQLFDKTGKLDLIRVAAKSGVPTPKLLREIRAVLPQTAQVRDADRQAKSDSKDTTSFLSFLQKFLLAFGGIALFVGSFVIANTLSITIAQRTREFATLRTLGASRRQVLGSVFVESLAIAILASLAGLFLGLGLAKGLNALFVAFGIDLPKAGTIFATRTIVVSLAVGIVITLLASLRPALRATRVPPIAAVREGSVLPPGRFARSRTPRAIAVTAIGLALLLYGVFGNHLQTATRLLSLGGGCILLFLGVASVAPALVRPLAGLLGWPGARVGGPAGKLARDNARRNPQRTASTAAALMIGLALVTFVAIIGAGLRSSFESAVNELFRADYALTAQNNFSPLDVSAADALRGVAGVMTVSGVRGSDGHAFGKTVQVTAVEPNVSQVIKLKWTAGSTETPSLLGSAGAFVGKDYAKKHHLAQGSQFQLETPSGAILDLQLKGIFDPPKGGSPFGQVTIAAKTFDRYYAQPANVFTFVNVAGGVSKTNTIALESALKQFPNGKISTASQFKKNQEQGINIILNLLYVLLGLSIIVSLFGIVNTLVLTVFERTRELGMLRAVGMTRRQVRRMIRHESIVTALIGAALGIPLGIVLAVLVGHTISFVAFAIPVGSLLAFVIAAVVVGILAAILPARRASRINVLEALQYE